MVLRAARKHGASPHPQPRPEGARRRARRGEPDVGIRCQEGTSEQGSDQPESVSSYRLARTGPLDPCGRQDPCATNVGCLLRPFAVVRERDDRYFRWWGLEQTTAAVSSFTKPQWVRLQVQEAEASRGVSGKPSQPDPSTDLRCERRGSAEADGRMPLARRRTPAGSRLVRCTVARGS